jgi:hypothetical protein
VAEDDQTESETKAPRSRGTRPTDRQTMGATSAPAAAGGQPQQGGMFGGGQRMMPWHQPQQGAPGQGGPMQGGGHPGFQWGGGGMPGGQPGGIMGGQGQGGMPNWGALAQQFQQRFAQQNPFLPRMGMTGQMPPGQAPAPAPQGQPQPGAAMQGGPFQGQIQRLAEMFGRQQPGGIQGPNTSGQRF